MTGFTTKYSGGLLEIKIWESEKAGFDLHIYS